MREKSSRIRCSLLAPWLLALLLLLLVVVPGSEAEETVYFNTQSKKFHCLECRSAKACTKNCVPVARSEALKRGGVACKNCGGTCGRAFAWVHEPGEWSGDFGEPGALSDDPTPSLDLPLWWVLSPALRTVLVTGGLVLLARLGLLLLLTYLEDRIDLVDWIRSLGRSRFDVEPRPMIWIWSIQGGAPGSPAARGATTTRARAPLVSEDHGGAHPKSSAPLCE